MNGLPELLQRAAASPGGTTPDKLPMVLKTAKPLTTPPRWNRARWVGPLDLSALCVANSHKLYGMGGVLVSPRAALFTAHYCPPVGTQLLWLTPNNKAEVRTIKAIERHPRAGYYNGLYLYDLALAVLDLPVNTIRPLEFCTGTEMRSDSVKPVKAGHTISWRLPTSDRLDAPNVKWLLTKNVYTGLGAVQATFYNELTTPFGKATVVAVSERLVPPWARPALAVGDSGQPVLLWTGQTLQLVGLLTWASGLTLTASEPEFLVKNMALRDS